MWNALQISTTFPFKTVVGSQKSDCVIKIWPHSHTRCRISFCCLGKVFVKVYEGGIVQASITCCTYMANTMQGVNFMSQKGVLNMDKTYGWQVPDWSCIWALKRLPKVNIHYNNKGAIEDEICIVFRSPWPWSPHCLGDCSGPRSQVAF